jgi:hypothetical protein
VKFGSFAKKKLILEVFAILIVILFITGSAVPSFINYYNHPGLQFISQSSTPIQSKVNNASVHFFSNKNKAIRTKGGFSLKQNDPSMNNSCEAYSINPLNGSISNGFGNLIQGLNIPYQMSFSSNGGCAFIPSLASTISVVNLSSYKIVKTIPLGGSLAGESIYVPTSRSLYVSNGNLIDIISTSSLNIYSSLDVKGIIYMTYDPSNANIFAASSNSNYSFIYDINTSTNSVTPIYNQTGEFIDDIIYGVSTGDVYFTISEVHGYYMGLLNTTNKYSKVIKVSNSSYEGNGLGNSLAYDSFTKTIYWVSSNQIDVINGSDLSVIGNFSYLNSCLGFLNVVFDDQNDNIYTTDGINVSRINITNYKSVNITINPMVIDISYNPENGNIYVINYFGKLERINPLNGSIEGAIQLSDQVNSLSYDPNNNDLYVSSISSGTVSVMNAQTNQFVSNISIPTPKYGISLGGPLAYDQFNNVIYMENIIIKLYSNGTISYSDDLLRINTTTNNITQTVNLNEEIGSIFFNSNNKILYITSAFTHSIALVNTINDDSISYVNIGNRSFGLAYDTKENVILVSTSHGIDFLNETINDIVKTISLQNGSIGLTYNPSNNDIYSENLYGNCGYIPIINASNGKIVGKLVTGAYSISSIATISHNSFILFNNLLALNISVFSTGGLSTHVFSLYKAHLIYFNSIPSIFSLPLIGNDQTICVSSSNLIYASNFLTGYIYVFHLKSLTAINYSITFNENNLPSGSNWYVNLSNGQSFSSSSSTISFSEPNGTYSYAVSTSDKTYSLLSSTGNFTVNGSSISESVIYYKVTYSVSFTESGLPSGMAWYVNLSNGMNSGPITGTSYSFFLTNGSYSYSVGNISGYSAISASGSMTVNGANISKTVTFSQINNSSLSSGISITELYDIVGAVLAVGIIGTVLAIIRKRR